ncbi:MAG: site-specific DNA-methyltransferase [Gammaproteobacteria bacterium]|nr:site-specific DNA-methyltransferase [Gammaproteobacteria bacterium]
MKLTTHNLVPIHPFPARMAPEVALTFIDSLPKQSLIVDPMMGSGTVIRTAVETGHSAVGVDIDPLAVLIARVWATPIDTDGLRQQARHLVHTAVSTPLDDVHLPWIDDDQETAEFIAYWFALRQRNALRKLSSLLAGRRGVVADALRLCISKMIVTKSRGASLADDVSHSRPHKVREINDYKVYDEFLKVVDRLATRLAHCDVQSRAVVRCGDARNLTLLEARSADAVITSPPYLNAIDYMRGHRLALVWLGYKVADLRGIRGTSVGTERSHLLKFEETSAYPLVARAGDLDNLPPRFKKMVLRYALDMEAVMAETHRVLKPGGSALFVVGNSRLRGVFVRNTEIITNCAKTQGLKLIGSRKRMIPSFKRYLPPPSTNARSQILGRMMEEVIITLAKPRSRRRVTALRAKTR